MVDALAGDVQGLCDLLPGPAQAARPLDVEGLVREVARSGRCVVVHEAPLSGGFGAEVVATLVEEAFYDLDAPVARVASYDVPYPAASLEQWYLPSVDRVVEAARKTVEA